jgi:fatty-acyl-CoA synthase
MLTAQEMRKSLAPYAPYPLHDLLARAAGRYGRRVAVIDGNRRFTYEQLSEYSNRFASALAKLGVRKGDRIAILAHADRTGARRS